MSAAAGSDRTSGAAHEAARDAEPGTEPGTGAEAGGHGGDTADSGDDAIEQLQRAVLTAIGATRVVLDALEAVVADRRRLEQLAETGRGTVGSLCAALFGGHSHSEPPPEPTDPPQDGAANA